MEPSLSAPSVRWTPPGQFDFLSQTKDFGDGAINWNYAEYGKLWAYNLNYFEYLLTGQITTRQGMDLIDAYCRVPSGLLKEGLEPFPTSLRTIFWIRFFIARNICAELPDPTVRFLYAQLRLLNRHIEYHLLGNHLLENGFGLLFGAYFFKDAGLYKTAGRLLRSELNEQILPDGGHFELSPMYHQLMTYRVLDSYNLVKNNPQIFSGGLSGFLKEKGEKMLGWLRQMTFRNGDIPYFSDAAPFIAPAGAELFDYARRLDLTIPEIPLAESGYRKFSTNSYELIADVGAAGPDYIPGHAHADALHFVLYVNNRPFLVDTGTSTYENDPVRHRERGTDAHNTVVYAGKDQSEVWGSFRVGRRAKTTIIEEQNFEYDHAQTTGYRLTARNDGYGRFGVVHERTFNCFQDKIVITDFLSGAADGKALAHIHFAPGINPLLQNDGSVLTALSSLHFEQAYNIDIAEYEYAEAWNKRSAAKKIAVAFNRRLSVTIQITQP